jgi:hypothetical protein
MVCDAGGNHDRGMNSPSQLHDRACDIVEAARGFQAAAEEPASHAAVPDSLAALEETLQVLTAAWYQLAGDSREHEVCLIGTLHDVAAAFARCARACREARRADGRRHGNEFPHFQRRERPGRRVA